MPFPLMVGDTRIPSPRRFGIAVLRDALDGGGTVLPDHTLCEWIPPLVASGALARSEAVAMVAALLRRPEPAILAEAARLAAAIGDPNLGPVLRLVLDTLDVGVLLHCDPVRPPGSVEDALLRGWASLARLDDPAVREEVIIRARNAGLADIEVRALALHGSADEIAARLPAVVEEGIPTGAGAWLVGGLARGDAVTDAIVDVVRGLPGPDRMVLWAAVRQHPVLSRDRPLQVRLFGR